MVRWCERSLEFGFFQRHLKKVCGLALSSLCERKDLFFLLPQVVSFTEMYKIFSELTDQIDQAGLTDEQRERDTEAKLSELRALSIVADD